MTYFSPSLCSHCSLNDTVEHFDNTTSPALNTVSPIKVEKRSRDRISQWLNNNSSVSECERVCGADVSMGKFSCITLTELCKTDTASNSSTSCAQPVPTAFIKQVFDSVSSHVLNPSLQTGTFPDPY